MIASANNKNPKISNFQKMSHEEAKFLSAQVLKEVTFRGSRMVEIKALELCVSKNLRANSNEIRFVAGLS